MIQENAVEFLQVKDKIHILDCLNKISLPKQLQDFGSETFEEKLEDWKLKLSEQLLGELSKDIPTLEPSMIVDLVRKILATGT